MVSKMYKNIISGKIFQLRFGIYDRRRCKREWRINNMNGKVI